jgi:hypothetical protein
MQELKANLDVAGRFHNEDLAAGYDGVFLEDAVKKTKCAKICYPAVALSATVVDGCDRDRRTAELSSA